MAFRKKNKKKIFKNVFIMKPDLNTTPYSDDTFPLKIQGSYEREEEGLYTAGIGVSRSAIQV